MMQQSKQNIINTINVLLNDNRIDHDYAKQAGAFVVATGRSDYPNQINNVLGFPYIFRNYFIFTFIGN
jgi:malic enzyme